ncbi:MAG: translation initiation factor IF-2 [Spirochaetaceae bacterium]|jgi:translation initiation factor IF-2|nr:translation initiation factor IF-2 [Spirochaetaceae bacterium]
MAEDAENKPKFILNKQKTSPGEPEPKKKFVVVKKTPKPQAQDAPQGEKGGPEAPESREKKRPVAKMRTQKPVQSAEDGRPAEGGEAPKRTFEVNAARPNVKAGNLSGKPRSGAGGRPRGRDFTGAQAREGYQNRFGDKAHGGKPGAPRQGGPQGAWQPRGGGQGKAPPGTGFPARQGAGPGRPGFGGAKPGFPPKPGFAPSAPPPEEGKKTGNKKVFKARKAVYTRKDREEDFNEDKLYNLKKKQSSRTSAIPASIEMMESITVSDLAKKMNIKASELIGKLMSMGMMITINQPIDADTATLLAAEYNCDVHIVSLYDETVIEQDKAEGEVAAPRPPVVTIMGHVDHGKTKTLDAIRSTHVAESEAGGITQKIGAYVVDTPKGRITFLDTPGHEAFTMMRSRGAAITDIVVLVVAADDGVMPQTVEAIDHAKAAGVPIIVAINKIDKAEANPDRVKTQLSELGLIPEDWGGQTQYVLISALKKEGLDGLLDAILLQAEILELKAVWNCRAEGKILDSKVDHGRGVVSTVLIERGTLKTGDPFVAGVYAGKIRAVFNDLGARVEEATPSMPVEILGMDSAPNAGDPFHVTDSEKTARAISAKRQELKRFESSRNVRKVTLDNLYETIDEGELLELKVIIKADVQGSAEALKSSLEKLSTKDIRLVVIHSSAGAINESDVMLAASDTSAIIIGFNVRPSGKAKSLAEQEGVEIRRYNVIYKAVEEITAAMEGMLKPNVREEVIGTVDVRQVFKVPKAGLVAGSVVKDGVVKRSASVHIIRDDIVIFTGKISSLRHLKDDVKDVAAGFECGIGIDGWQDIREGDQFEVFEYVEVARKLSDSADAKPEEKP